MGKQKRISEDWRTLLEKIKKMEQGERLDLSSREDLAIGVMNLIAIEEHLFFSWGRTKKERYLELLNKVRQLRKQLLKKLIKRAEGEVWCISKHLLAGCMRLMEVGTKLLGKGEKKEAIELFQKSYALYTLFWGLNLGVVELEEIKDRKKKTINFLSEDLPPKKKGSATIWTKLGELVRKAVNCCLE